MSLAKCKLVITAACAIFVVGSQTQAQTEKIIYSFAGGSDGASPEGGLVPDGKGNLYGVTELGGINGGGTVFELSPSSGGTWTKFVLHDFNYVQDVYLPTSNLVFDTKGNLFGIAPLGGANGAGGIFELSPGVGGNWTETVLFNFAGGDDIVPFQTGLAIDKEGNLYGYRATVFTSTGTQSYGAVWEVSSSKGIWAEKILHTFTGGDDGSAIYAGGLALDDSGNLFGMAGNGARDYGLVFELVKGTNGTWSEKMLHSFKGGADGSAGYGTRVLVDSAGNVFCASLWAILEFVPGSDGTWTETILHTFTGGSDGAYPSSGVTMGSGGQLYGTTNEGGAHHGTVFALIHGSDGIWSEKILHRFSTSGGDGSSPAYAPLVLDAHGNVYGVTGLGGNLNNGVIFEIMP